MARRRMNIRVIKEILRLKFDRGFSIRQISRSVNKGKSGTQRLIRKAEEAGLGWPLPEDVSDESLERLLYPEGEKASGGKVVPGWEHVRRELKRSGVTRQLLWEEYAQNHPDNHYSYSRYCELYDAWCKENVGPSMRQTHKAGEKCFVDYAGHRIATKNCETGGVIKAQVFVGVLGASNYIFAEAVPSQSLENWLGSHTRMLEYFGGVPSLVVPDNLRSGVKRACRYDPEVNPAYKQWADHYGTVIMPARPRKPKDKSKVEVGVQIVERRILAALRDEEFFSLGELNRRIGQLLEDLNGRCFQKLEGTRRSEFERVEKPELKPLPRQPYRYVETKRAKVNIDYHVEYKKTLYSVPHNYISKRVDVRAGANTVEIYFGEELVARHRRVDRGGCVTELSHMPESHQHHAGWSPERLRRWAAEVGPEAHKWVSWQLESRDHPAQAYRVCLGLLNLSRDYPRRLEDACGVANRKGLVRLKQVRNLLKNSMDKLPLADGNSGSALPQDHENIRGPEQYK